ncbi:hypothetical protein BJX61DRAFT_542893 [Aspergillus egyptiacus]|nr:hypothetical protein BJX61DRAFT_542893 [Aspergillus egyptiacus]
MATASVVSTPLALNAAKQAPRYEDSPSQSPVTLMGPDSNAAATGLGIRAPFPAIRNLFDHLYKQQADAAALNATYPRRGIFKTAAITKTESDQKFTLDFSPARNARISDSLRKGLPGIDEILGFFNGVVERTVPSILESLGALAGTDFSNTHKMLNMNFRLCDYNPVTAAPESENGCGAHTDYGTFMIIFQDGTTGLELEDSAAPGGWRPVPGDATVILTGLCAVILSGGRISAARHRVRRSPGVRRLSAVLFLAPDLDVKLQPLNGIEPVKPMSDAVMRGEMDVENFKEVMGKRWRYREGNEDMEGGEMASQDSEIEKLVWL